ncbi:hypothetical protein ACMFMG_001345 [Clarireedia jacksonii]
MHHHIRIEPSIYKAAVDHLANHHCDAPLVQLFLAKGLNPNKYKGLCFILPSKADTEPEFRALCKHADLGVVLGAFINHFKEEQQIVYWFNICLQEQSHSVKAVDHNDLVFQFTKVSVVFAYLLDEAQSPILKTLLDLDREQTLRQAIPGSTVAYLGTYPTVCKTDLDSMGELPLLDAALYLGNFEAVRLMNEGKTANDGRLHTAAFLALPKFVDWLLDFHDADYKSEEYNNYIPLALACKAKSSPWCKIANEEADWRTRQTETLHILARRTGSGWRHRKGTVLHIALENGIETTKAMISALHIRADPGKYLYIDKDGIEYSPHQWLSKFLDAEKEDRAVLIKCLHGCGMKSRCF